ncbi:MAG: tetratricopeptide repeat protein, partial [Stellaceae bacterium]
MWGKCLVACAALTALAAAGPVRAQTSDRQWDWCKGDNADLSIGGCTAIIQSGQETTMNLAIAFYDRGNAYDDKGEYDKAIADYTQALQLDPRHETALVNRGLAYKHKGDYDRAIADFNAALGLKPDDEDAYIDRGLTFEKKNQYDRAEQDYS